MLTSLLSPLRYYFHPASGRRQWAGETSLENEPQDVSQLAGSTEDKNEGKDSLKGEGSVGQSAKEAEQKERAVVDIEVDMEWEVNADAYPSAEEEEEDVEEEEEDVEDGGEYSNGEQDGQEMFVTTRGRVEEQVKELQDKIRALEVQYGSLNPHPHPNPT